jgi:hypothetical protein
MCYPGGLSWGKCFFFNATQPCYIFIFFCRNQILMVPKGLYEPRISALTQCAPESFPFRRSERRNRVYVGSAFYKICSTHADHILQKNINWKVVAISPYAEHMPKLVPCLAEHQRKLVILWLNILKNWIGLPLIFLLKISNKMVQAPSCERPKTAPRTLFLSFANYNCLPITL